MFTKTCAQKCQSRICQEQEAAHLCMNRRRRTTPWGCICTMKYQTAERRNKPFLPKYKWISQTVSKKHHPSISLQSFLWKVWFLFMKLNKFEELIILLRRENERYKWEFGVWEVFHLSLCRAFGAAGGVGGGEGGKFYSASHVYFIHRSVFKIKNKWRRDT